VHVQVEDHGRGLFELVYQLIAHPYQHVQHRPS
jgi:hypothetical protein